MTAKEHYDTLLGDVYSWMLGDFTQRMLEQKHFFIAHHIHPTGNGIALDLGAGNGIQSVALAELGFKVKAVDFNATLLAELNTTKNKLPIEIYMQDISTFMNKTNEPAEVIICMGDTLTHFDGYSVVTDLVRKIAAILPRDGKAIFSWRDFSEERSGLDRFIHVRSDDTRSMTCFLEYSPHHVTVHDLIVEKINGEWRQRVSRYPKLRLPVTLFSATLRENGLSIEHQQVNRGMIALVARKI